MLLCEPFLSLELPLALLDHRILRLLELTSVVSVNPRVVIDVIELLVNSILRLLSWLLIFLKREIVTFGIFGERVLRISPFILSGDLRISVRTFEMSISRSFFSCARFHEPLLMS
jgi:hypothetical protein